MMPSAQFNLFWLFRLAAKVLYGAAPVSPRKLRPGKPPMNSARECARRRRQLAAGQLVGIGAKQ